MNRRQALKAWIGGLLGVAAAPVVAKAAESGEVLGKFVMTGEQAVQAIAAAGLKQRSVRLYRDENNPHLWHVVVTYT